MACALREARIKQQTNRMRARRTKHDAYQSSSISQAHCALHGQGGGRGVAVKTKCGECAHLKKLNAYWPHGVVNRQIEMIDILWAIITRVVVM